MRASTRATRPLSQGCRPRSARRCTRRRVSSGWDLAAKVLTPPARARSPCFLASSPGEWRGPAARATIRAPPPPTPHARTRLATTSTTSAHSTNPCRTSATRPSICTRRFASHAARAGVTLAALRAHARATTARRSDAIPTTPLPGAARVTNAAARSVSAAGCIATPPCAATPPRTTLSSASSTMRTTTAAMTPSPPPLPNQPNPPENPTAPAPTPPRTDPAVDASTSALRATRDTSGNARRDARGLTTRRARGWRRRASRDRTPAKVSFSCLRSRTWIGNVLDTTSRFTRRSARDARPRRRRRRGRTLGRSPRWPDQRRWLGFSSWRR